MAKVYNADEVTISIGDLLIDSGYADGSFVTVDEASPRIVKSVGTDGEVAIGRHSDRSATITLKLMQTSDANDALSALAILNEGGPGLPAIAPIMVRDRNGRSLHEADSCWIESMPSSDYDRSAGSREWVIGVDRLRNFVGGNTRA